MNEIIGIITVVLLITNFYLVGRSRLDTLIYTVSCQGIMLGLLPLFLHWFHFTWYLIFVTLISITIKGIVIPILLLKALRGVGISREIEPSIGYTLSTFIVIGLTLFSFVIGRQLEASALFPYPQCIPVAASIVFSGLFLTIARKKAITQIIGYLALENGIYLFGVSLAVEQSFVVELGVLLDLLVGVFIMGILIYRINREFDNIDTESLEVLRD